MLGDRLCRFKVEINHRSYRQAVSPKRITSRSACRIWASKFLYSLRMPTPRFLLADSSTFRTIKSGCRCKSLRQSLTGSAVKYPMLANSSKALATLRRINKSCRISPSKSLLSLKWCHISIKSQNFQIEMCKERQQLKKFRSTKLKLSIQFNGSRIRT